MALEFLYSGPPDSRAKVVLAHGSGQPMDSPFMTALAEGLGTAGVRVARFEFPYMRQIRAGAKQRPPDKAPLLQQTWLEVLEHLGSGWVIGGKSLGGRMASMVADQAETAGLLCLGYPFHPPGRPDTLRIEHLRGLKTPALIIQGTRDPFGRYDEVGTYPLASQIRLEWIDGGGHSYEPSASSGRTHQQNLAAALEVAEGFVKSTGRDR